VEQFVRITGIAAPLLRINVDTDQIIPGSEIMRSVDESYERWGKGLFAHWRYIENRTPNPEFILNRPPFDRAQILLADRNFGCGSSREPAPKALRGFGFRAVLAPSFGGIFYNNCFRNGLLPVELPIDKVLEIEEEVEGDPAGRLVTVDLEGEFVESSRGDRYEFRTPKLLRRMMLDGLDEIELTLSQAPRISAFRQKDRDRRPWAYPPTSPIF
jgi:3-isopropylmalate/(R)-2-methylmalate dehydratase small subunit